MEENQALKYVLGSDKKNLLGNHWTAKSVVNKILFKLQTLVFLNAFYHIDIKMKKKKKSPILVRYSICFYRSHLLKVAHMTAMSIDSQKVDELPLWLLASHSFLCVSRMYYAREITDTPLQRLDNIFQSVRMWLIVDTWYHERDDFRQLWCSQSKKKCIQGMAFSHGKLRQISLSDAPISTKCCWTEARFLIMLSSFKPFRQEGTLFITELPV